MVLPSPAQFARAGRARLGQQAHTHGVVLLRLLPPPDLGEEADKSGPWRFGEGIDLDQGAGVAEGFCRRRSQPFDECPEQ